MNNWMLSLLLSPVPQTVGPPIPASMTSVSVATRTDRFAGLTLRTTTYPDWVPSDHRGTLRRQLREHGVRYVSVDVETTGFPVHPGSVTEIGFYDATDGVGGAFVPPHDETRMHPQARTISRYDERIAVQTPDPTQVAHLHRILGGDGTTVYLVGSNLPFDKAHLNELFRAYDLPTDPWHHRTIEVGQRAAALTDDPFAPPLGLADAAALAEVDSSGHHDAYEDAMMAAHIWHNLITLQSRRVTPPF